VQPAQLMPGNVRNLLIWEAITPSYGSGGWGFEFSRAHCITYLVTTSWSTVFGVEATDRTIHRTSCRMLDLTAGPRLNGVQEVASSNLAAPIGLTAVSTSGYREVPESANSALPEQSPELFASFDSPPPSEVPKGGDLSLWLALRHQ